MTDAVYFDITKLYQKHSREFCATTQLRYWAQLSLQVLRREVDSLNAKLIKKTNDIFHLEIKSLMKLDANWKCIQKNIY